jgi:serine/threonine-protein kinase RsbW
MQSRIRLTIDSNLDNVPLVATTVTRLCSLVTFSDVESYQVELCVVEAVNNAIKHAYLKEGGHEVDVIFTIYENKLMIDISDSGKAMGEMKKPCLDFDPYDIKNLPESGMGLFIIDSMMDEWNYKSQHGKNVLTMTKFFKPAERKSGSSV